MSTPIKVPLSIMEQYNNICTNIKEEHTKTKKRNGDTLTDPRSEKISRKDISNSFDSPIKRTLNWNICTKVEFPSDEVLPSN